MVSSHFDINLEYSEKWPLKQVMFQPSVTSESMVNTVVSFTAFVALCEPGHLVRYLNTDVQVPLLFTVSGTPVESRPMSEGVVWLSLHIIHSCIFIQSKIC